MKNTFKCLIVIILLFSLGFVNSSSGVTSFFAEREVNMKVVDSSNAFIAIPDVITLHITVLKTLISYYNLELPENQEDNLLIDETNVVKINDVLLTKTLVDTAETCTITDVSSNLDVRNNLNTELNICNVNFDNPLLSCSDNNITVPPGFEKKLLIRIADSSTQISNIIEQLGTNGKAVLVFKWDGGNSVINVNINLDVTVNKENKEVYLNKDYIEEQLNNSEG